MSASIFSLSRSSCAARVTGRDWSTQELAELYRVCDRLVEAGLKIHLYRGLSDEGEPWAVFERVDGEVVVHIARIDGSLIVVNGSTSQVYKGVDFRTVTEQMLVDAPLALPRRQDEGKVVYHPRAVFTAFVAAAVVVTEMARGIADAEAGEVGAEMEAGQTGSGMIAQLMARFLARDSVQPANMLAGGAGAFGVAGAAALAAEMFAFDIETAATLAMAGEIDTVATAGQSAEADGASAEGKAGARQAEGSDQAPADLLTHMQVAEAGLALDMLPAQPAGATPSGGPGEKADGPSPKAALDGEAPSEGETAAQIVDPAEADMSASETAARSGRTGERPEPAQDNGAAAPVEEPSGAGSSVGPASSVSGERQKIVEVVFFDPAERKSAADEASGPTTVLPLKPALFDPEETEIAASGLETVEDSPLVMHETADGGIYILDAGSQERIVYTGGDVILHNFRFGQDQIQIDHMGSSGQWYQEMNINGNDVHLIGVDGGSIILYESLHSLA